MECLSNGADLKGGYSSPMITDFKELIADNFISVNCANCNQEMKISGKDVFEEGKEIPCPACNGVFMVTHNASFKDDVESINTILQRLDNMFK